MCTASVHVDTAFKVCLHYHPARREQPGSINFLTILKDWLSSCNQNRRKTVAPHITHLICSLVSLQPQQMPSIFVCLPVTHYICSHTETMSSKFREISRIRQE